MIQPFFCSLFHLFLLAPALTHNDILMHNKKQTIFQPLFIIYNHVGEIFHYPEVGSGLGQVIQRPGNGGPVVMDSHQGRAAVENLAELEALPPAWQVDLFGQDAAADVKKLAVGSGAALVCKTQFQQGNFKKTTADGQVAGAVGISAEQGMKKTRQPGGEFHGQPAGRLSRGQGDPLQRADRIFIGGWNAVF